MGSNSSSPTIAFPEIAHCVLTAAIAPISRVPRGVPAPINTLRSPTILPPHLGGRGQQGDRTLHGAEPCLPESFEGQQHER